MPGFMVNTNSLNIGIWFGSIDGAHTEAQREGAGDYITAEMRVPAGVKVTVHPAAAASVPLCADFVIEIEGYRKDLAAVVEDVLTQFESSLGDWNGLYGKTKKQHLADLNRAELLLGAFRVRS